MLRSIMVPIDGSPLSEQALQPAVSLAMRDGARLDLVMVVEPVSSLGRIHGVPVIDPRLDQELRREKAAYLTELAARIQREESVQATAVLLEGPVAATLAERASEGVADLLVMTTHGRGGLSRMWLGSVADAVLRRVEIPVLLVRPREEMTDAAATTFPPRRVLVTLDGSEEAEAVFDHAVAVAGTTDVTFLLARASDPEPALPYRERRSEFPREDRAAVRFDRASAYLEDTARRVGKRGPTIETRVLGGLNTPRGILECARDWNADLIALATHARARLARLIVGSVADAVLRGAPIPVLVSRLPEPQRLVDDGSNRRGSRSRRSAHT